MVFLQIRMLHHSATTNEWCPSSSTAACHFTILERDEAEVNLTLQPNHKAAPFNVARMVVDDADALHAICQRYGLRIIKSIQDKDYGLRAFVFEDPDGNRIDVGQPI
jgi:catechol 2,3-dioxygenase-like lactoylglutathione lyase family enzyme